MVVGIDPSGTAHSVRVLQRIVVKRIGDYIFAIPAPVRSVEPGPGTESQPGQRQNQVLWQGFSPGRRVLSAWADLRPADSIASLPIRVRVQTEVDGTPLLPGEKRSGDLRLTITVENATAADAKSFSAEADPRDLAVVLSRIRAAIRSDVYAEGLNVRLRGRSTPVRARVAAPLRLEGMLTFEPGTVKLKSAIANVARFGAVVDGIDRRSMELVLTGRATKASVPRLELEVTTADILDPVASSQDVRTRLKGTIALELAYARKRQYDQFLVSPDATGPSSTTYVYRTAEPPRPAATGISSGGGSHTLGWIILGLALAAGIPAAAVIWARS